MAVSSLGEPVCRRPAVCFGIVTLPTSPDRSARAHRDATIRLRSISMNPDVLRGDQIPGRSRHRRVAPHGDPHVARGRRPDLRPGRDGDGVGRGRPEVRARLRASLPISFHRPAGDAAAAREQAQRRLEFVLQARFLARGQAEVPFLVARSRADTILLLRSYMVTFPCEVTVEPAHHRGAITRKI